MTAEEVLDLLEELGEGGQDVADTLYDLKIKGDRDKAGSCPLANYLRSQGVADARVNCDELEWGEFREVLALPEGCGDFVVRFDAGAFPDLLEGP